MYDLEAVSATKMDDKLTLIVLARGYNTNTSLLRTDVITIELNLTNEAAFLMC